MIIRYRWSGPEDKAPMHGCYIMSTRRPRCGYLIIGVDNRGRRGGLGAPVHTLLVLTVERVSVAEAQQSDRCFSIKWDPRTKKARRHAMVG